MGYWERFRRYTAGGPEAIDGWPQPIPVADFNVATAASLGAALKSDGFEAVGPRRWVRSARAPIRDVFELEARKGAAYAAVWGFSLDFVPHVSAEKVRWHRTAKSARLDLIYRPTDVAEDRDEAAEWCVSPTFSTPDELAEDLGRIVTVGVPRARAFWSQVHDVPSLLLAFEKRRAHPSYDCPFDHSLQERLAYPFVLAKAGRDGASALLAEFVKDFTISPTVATQLADLLGEAGGRTS